MTTQSSKLERTIRREKLRLESKFFLDMMNLLRKQYGVEFAEEPAMIIGKEKSKVHSGVPHIYYREKGIEIERNSANDSCISYRLVASGRTGSGDFLMEVSFYEREWDCVTLTLGRRINLDEKYPIFLRNFANFGSITASYDLSNPAVKLELGKIAGINVPATMLRRSDTSVKGELTPDGIEGIVKLGMQNPDKSKPLNCYEVEIKERFQSDPLSGKIVPSSIYQPEERHFCMTGAEYPLIPVDLNEVSRLTLLLDTFTRGIYGNSWRSISVANLVSVAGGVPLSLEGGVNWCAETHTKRGSLSLMGGPALNGSLWLVLGENYNSVSPEQVYRRAVEFMNHNAKIVKKLDSIKHNSQQV